jgi:hypothetical protein
MVASTYPLSSLLSTDDNHTLTQWIRTKNKPLFLKGHGGSGKTYWAKELLKDYHIISIGSEYIKASHDITEHLETSLFKKDIFMMISPSKQYKALMVDDIQLFSQHDKPLLTKVHKFVQTIDYKQHPVIYVCNDTTDKCIKLMKERSYVITLRFHAPHYTQILSPYHNDVTDITRLLTHSHNLHTLMTTIHKTKDVLQDKRYTVDTTITNIMNTDTYCEDILRDCSYEYSIISLNILENIPTIVNHISARRIHHMYKSACIGDYIEYKYIHTNIDLDLRVFYACVLPIHQLKHAPEQGSFTNTLKYNTYISRSIIQIHNQSILQNNTVIYLRLLSYIYEMISSYKSDITPHMLQEYIHTHAINLKTLEKQMKVFNYYYHKQMNKKQFTKITKQLTCHSKGKISAE